MMRSILIVLVAVGLASALPLTRKTFTVRTDAGTVEVEEVMPKAEQDTAPNPQILHQSGLDIEPSIVGGKAVKDKQKFPQVVSIVRAYPNGFYETFCSGVIIDGRVVMSAAHCFSNLSGGLSYFVCSGTVDIYNDVNQIKCGKIKEAWVPKKYNNNKFFNGYDMAILKIQKVITGKFASRARISFDKPANGMDVFAAGFGITKFDSMPDGKLRYVEAKVVLNEGQCKVLNELGLKNDSDLMCSKSKKSVMCQGDSGGPLLAGTDRMRRFVCIGVLSFGVKGCVKNKESVYSSLYDKSHQKVFKFMVDKVGGTYLEHSL